jgi:hypothetical protein
LKSDGNYLLRLSTVLPVYSVRAGTPEWPSTAVHQPFLLQLKETVIAAVVHITILHITEK